MSILSADEKTVEVPFYRNRCSFSTRILLACIVFCCHSIESSSQTNREPIVAPLAASGSMSEDLYRLYIANTLQNPQLDKLLKHSHEHRKVVFQFYHTDSGFLSLKAWPGKRRNRRFYLGEEILLSRAPGNIVDTTLTGLNVHLGDLQMNKRAVKALRAKINDSRHNDEAYNSILFIPEIRVDAKNRINHVVYTIKASTGSRASSVSKASAASALPESILSSITRLNPSPPYSVKQDE